MKPVRGRKKILAFFFQKEKVAESSVCENLAAILSFVESSFAESSCNLLCPLLFYLIKKIWFHILNYELCLQNLFVIFGQNILPKISHFFT